MCFAQVVEIVKLKHMTMLLLVFNLKCLGSHVASSNNRHSSHYEECLFCGREHLFE
uniref:Uncharacterized protein n=1 Tax=Octopus bimaculoides TaxID=37653 RepID=A0A0L8H6K1_OCTBM